jgi:hypothetical protein
LTTIDVAVEFGGNVTTTFAGQLITGGVVSTTFTVRVAVLGFAPSVAVYVIVYVPGMFTLTLPEGVA